MKEVVLSTGIQKSERISGWNNQRRLINELLPTMVILDDRVAMDEWQKEYSAGRMT